MTEAELYRRIRLLEEENGRLREQALSCILENLILRQLDAQTEAAQLTECLGVDMSRAQTAMLLIYPAGRGELREDIAALVRPAVIHAAAQWDAAFFTAPGGAVGCLMYRAGGEDERVSERILANDCLDCLAALRASGCNLCAALSSVGRGSDGVRRLYREALTARDHAQPPPSLLRRYSELSSAGEAGDCRELERGFISAVSRKRFYEAVSLLDSITDNEIHHELQPLEVVASSLFFRLQLVLALCGIDGAPPPQGGEESVADALERVMRAPDFSAQRDAVHDVFALLDDCCSEQGTGRKIDAVTAFVAGHYNDPALGAAMLCDEFKFSPSYLSRLFKKELSVGVVDHIRSVRVAEAKRLLRETGMTVEQVGVRVGFASRATFIRAFKACENVTPSLYREQDRAQSDGRAGSGELSVRRAARPKFCVIGMEGSTLDGENFVARLWERANREFPCIEPLTVKDSDGTIAGVWGAMSDMARRFMPWEEDFTRGLYLAGAECRMDAEPPEGWTKWIVPGFEYIQIDSDGPETFREGLKYLDDHGLKLAGAVQELTRPAAGKSYMLFPVRRLED